MHFARMQNSWTQTLAEFLRKTPGAGAVRLDPASRRVQVATLGEVDTAELREQLEATLAAIGDELDAAAKDDRAADAASGVPEGFRLTRQVKLGINAELPYYVAVSRAAA